MQVTLPKYSNHNNQWLPYEVLSIVFAVTVGTKAAVITNFQASNAT
jgi:hypothetical protein